MISNQREIDWAEIVDLLAHEYSWTIDYIKELNMQQVNLLIAAISRRYRAKNNALSGQGPAMSNKEGFQADNVEKQIGTLLSWGAKKEIGPDGKERYTI